MKAENEVNDNRVVKMVFQLFLLPLLKIKFLQTYFLTQRGRSLNHGLAHLAVSPLVLAIGADLSMAEAVPAFTKLKFSTTINTEEILFSTFIHYLAPLIRPPCL
jgi:hypothetical protein